jgi:uroporphyrinogen decarboxylase
MNTIHQGNTVDPMELNDTADQNRVELTGRQRMLTAFSLHEPDHVPVSPDLSAMVPVRLSGRPFDEMFLDGREHHGYASASVAEAYVEAVRYYGMDGWYIYGSLPPVIPPDRPRWETRLAGRPGGGQIKYQTAQTPYGELTQQIDYFADEPPWEQVKPIKDLKRDWPRLRSLMGEDEKWEWEREFKDRDRIGELGVYSVSIGIPQDWWFFQRHGGYNATFFDYADEPVYMQEVFEFYSRYAIARLRALLKASPPPDEIMLGGSASSLSASSPANFRRYDLPFIKEAATLCNQVGVFPHLHVCGKSNKIVEMVAEETEVKVMEPLEEPPGGNVDIGEMKRRYGDRLCLKGNLNTFQFMLSATPEQVEEKAKRLIDLCGEGGGFVLSTGDQCGRDTPDANLFKLVEVAQTYGKY